MNEALPPDVKEVLWALVELGGEGDVGRIKDQITELRGGVPPHYKDENSYRNTIQRCIENYCPQAEDYDPVRPPLFDRVVRGRYKLIHESDRPKFGLPPRAV